MPPARRVLIAGLGLIGGSAGMALRGEGWHVGYVDPAVVLQDARASGAADIREDSLTAAHDYDLTILATPVDVTVRMLEEIDADNPVTTVCSVMGPLHEIGLRRGLRLVAGHPFAGSEQRSLAAARADLFAGRTWFLEETAANDLVEQVARHCGATIERIASADHDRMMAATSHLPQVLSTALAAWLDVHPELAKHAGSGLRTFLRLAAGDGSVWAPILEANRANLERPSREVSALVEELLAGRESDAFARAQHFLSTLDGGGRS